MVVPFQFYYGEKEKNDSCMNQPSEDRMYLNFVLYISDLGIKYLEAVSLMSKLVLCKKLFKHKVAK